MVTFKEDTHQYFNENGVEYKSGTGFLHLYDKEFDSIGVATKVANREGISVDDILERWKKNSEEACAYGTSIHLIMENYLKTGIKLPEHSLLYESFDDITGNMRKWAKAVHSERMLWNDEHQIAGTADLIIDHNKNEFSVGDFKTNKAINFCNEWGERMLKPISHLSSCNYNLYSLQLSLYAHMYSLLTGKQCRRVFLMHLKEDGRWHEITANFMKHEVEVLFHHYKTHILKKWL